MDPFERVKWDVRGVVPVVVQDAGSGQVLALDAMDRACLTESLSTGMAVYWRPEDAWPGERPSCAGGGVAQMITEATLSCDGQAVLLRVQPAGPLCRTGEASCFTEDMVVPLEVEAPNRSARRSAVSGAVLWTPESAEGEGE